MQPNRDFPERSGERADALAALAILALAAAIALLVVAVWPRPAGARPHHDRSWRADVPMPRARPAEAPARESSPPAVLASAVPGEVEAPRNIIADYERALYVPAHQAVRMTCPGGRSLPALLRTMLNAAAAHFACTVSVVSAYRSPAHNRAVHGARRSQHMACRAVDIVVPCAAKDAVFAWVKRQPGIRGAGIYRSRLIHADVRPGKRLVTWDWRRGKRYARRHHRRAV